MSFLSTLGKVINEQFGFGENSVTNIDTGSGRVPDFGLLGDFANKIDQRAWRTYIEDGFVRNVRPRIREAIFQQPDICVLVKKRMFSSLSENYRPDLSNDEERLFLLASKRLFQNKCRAIAAYELLSKIENIAADAGYVNSYTMPLIFDGISILDDAGIDIIDDKTRTVLQTIKRVHAFSEPNSQTTWLIDQQLPYATALGEGTGVIELALVASVSTRAGVDFGSGSASLTIEDPYKLLVVTSDEIDTAIKDSVSFGHGSFGTFVHVETQNLIEQQKQQLNLARARRGAARIRFIITPESLISKRVRAMLESGFLGGPNVIGSENARPTPEINFTYNPGFVGIGGSVDLDPIATQGKQGLNSSEASLFKEIIKNTFLLLGFENTTKQDRITFNKARNYVRRKMRLHFSGMPIIQPMDIVNVFMTSKTRIDDTLIHGFDSANTSKGFTFANKLDSLVRNINTNFGDLTGFFKGTQNSLDEVEKAAIVGAEFPTWLWRLYRNDFTRQGAGTCVFVGLVKGAHHSYSSGNGKNMLNVDCEDNAGYFNKSQINIRPALDVFNQSLYDPLTPFDVSFDASTGTPLTDATGFPELLPENKQILHSAAAKFSNGLLRGEKVDEFLYRTKDGELTRTGFIGYRQVLSDPNGFVYRWKEGIGSLTKTERSVAETSITQESSPLLTANPFAGQDVMNVLSLLVTGQPYNYNTFVQAALANGNSLVSHDPTQNKQPATTYIEFLTNQLVKRNVIWGNFVPFKKLVLNEQADQFIRSGQASFITYNQTLNSLLQQRASLQDELSTRERGFMANPQMISRDSKGQYNTAPENAGVINNDLKSKIASLDAEINSAKVAFQNASTQLAGQNLDNKILIIGDDISLAPGTTDAGSSATEEQRNTDREELRRNMNILTQRRLWKVKSNDDPNLFIVDDQYDKNYDIQAFERKLGGQLNLFSSEYISVDSRIKEIAELLGLEVFADTQGHIQIRPPQYNRMPSSVFYRMFRDKANTGIQVFPQFLESLFFNQVQGMINRIEIIEDEIRILSLILGVVPDIAWNPDDAIVKFLRGSSFAGNVAFDKTQFKFLSDYNTGRINSFVQLSTQARPDINSDLATRVLVPISEQANQAAQAQRIFDAVSRTDIQKRINYAASTAAYTETRIAKIANRLAREKGVTPPDRRSLFADDRLTRGKVNDFSALDVLHITNQIAQSIAERQKILPQLASTLKNLADGVQLNESNKGATSALFPMLNRSQPGGIPQILQHMIEPEDLDDLGPGAGARFVIQDSKILELKIEETAPPYTLVQVNGLFGQGFVDAPPNLRLTNDGGNAITSAFAVDYDMWRRYGFRTSRAVPAPYFSDPDTQCAPYAVFLLNLARKNILQGSITVIGNEFYQPGDVVYIEDRDLLFYVTDVAHSFSYSGSFTTSLTLKYGHPPGEYIPTILDIVGAQLYNTRNFSQSFRSNRFDNPSDGTPVGTITFPNMSAGFFSSPDSVHDQLLWGSVGEANRKTLNNLLVATTGTLSQVNFRRVKPTLELRVFWSSELASEPDSALMDAASQVRDWMINPQEFDKGSGDKTIPISVVYQQPSQNDNIKIVPIDVTADGAASPSKLAWHSARMFTDSSFLTDTDIDTEKINNAAMALDDVLYKHIIDAVMVYDTVQVTTEVTPSTAGQLNQSAQETIAAVNDALTKRSET